MTVTAWKNPANAFDDSGGSRSWDVPTNTLTSNNAHAEALDVSPGRDSNPLRCIGFFSAADIPVGAVVDGVEVQIERHASNANASDSKLRLVAAGSQVGTNKALTATAWPASDQFQAYGGPTDMWGTTLSRDDLINSGFGVRLQVEGSATAGTNVLVDVIQCRVYYTAAPTGSIVKVWNGSAWVAKPIMRWDGSAWQPAPMKRWNGSSWVDV